MKSTLLKKRSKVSKLHKGMNVIETVLPAYRDNLIYKITPKSVREIFELEDIDPKIKDWFKDNVHIEADEDIFWEALETDTTHLLSDKERETIKALVDVYPETIRIRRISMFQLMKTKHYPQELSSFVQQSMKEEEAPKEGEEPKDKKLSEEEQITALTFYQWAACEASIEPKIMSREKVVSVLNGKDVGKHWFDSKEKERLSDIRRKYKDMYEGREITEDDVVSMKEFTEELWFANDPIDPEKKVNVWWIEDMKSDQDLMHISTTAMQGIQEDEKEYLKSFRS